MKMEVRGVAEYIPTPRAVSTLIVIEAPGKVPALTIALKRAGLDDFYILATKGRLLDTPDDLARIGVDRNLAESARVARNPEIIDSLVQWAAAAKNIWVACDADQEGDGLAWDIAQVLPRHTNLQRVRLRALDAAGVQHAITHAEPLSYRDSWPYTTRRVLDRLVAFAFARSKVEGESDPAIARVQFGLIGALEREQIPYAEATIALKACDGRGPFVAVIPVFEHNEDDVHRLIAFAEDFESEGRCLKVGSAEPAPDFKPWSYGDAILAIAQATGRDIEQAAHSLQRLYESGLLSYPRSGSHAVSGEALACIAAVADNAGARFDASRVEAFVRAARHANESVRPLTADVDITKPLLMLPPDQAALSMVARHLLACGQPHAIHRPEQSAIPEWAEALNLERTLCQWLCPWPRRHAVTGLRPIPQEEAAFRMLMKYQLGRPLTQVRHAVLFASQGFMDERLQITDKARRWVDGAPQVLRDPRTSSAIEGLINAGADEGEFAEPPPQVVRKVIDFLGVWDAMAALLEAPAKDVQSGLLGARTDEKPR
jgi:hypothetical protein